MRTSANGIHSSRRATAMMCTLLLVIALVAVLAKDRLEKLTDGVARFFDDVMLHLLPPPDPRLGLQIEAAQDRGSAKRLSTVERLVTRRVLK